MSKNIKGSSKQGGIKSYLINLESYLIKWGLLNDRTQPRSSESDGRIYSSYSPHHPKAGQRLNFSDSEEPRTMTEAWRAMDIYQQSLLGLACTAFAIFMFFMVGPIMFIAFISIILLALVLLNIGPLKVKLSKLITR